MGSDVNASGSPAVLLTGVGKRYDIVSAFARHATTIAADPNPLAPAQYAAHHRTSVPGSTTPNTSPPSARSAKIIMLVPLCH